jgi:hypothetical protein
MQLLVARQQVRRLAILNIIYVLFVFGSGDQATFSFNASAIIRWQEGLYIVNALPCRKGCLARGTRHESGTLYLFAARHVARTIAKNFAHSHPNYQLSLGVFCQQRIVVIDACDALKAQPVWLFEIDEEHADLRVPSKLPME